MASFNEHQRYEDERRIERERRGALYMARKRLNQAFRSLRRDGLLAKQSYWCCLSCAASNIESEAKPGKSHPIGYVLYTKQAGFLRDDGSGRVRKLVLNFGSLGPDSDKKGRRAKAVGELIQKTLEDCGLTVEWSGNFLHSMVVDPCPGLWSNTDIKAKAKARVKSPRTRFERVS